MNPSYRSQRRARLVIALAFFSIAAALIVIGVTAP